MPPSEYPVCFAGNTVKFNTSQPEILQAIQTHFAACGGKEGSLVAHYHIAAIAEKVYTISANGSVLHSRLNFEQTLWHLMQDALTSLNGSARNGAVFHAAALEKAGKGVILCGQSGSGKTSLTAWLLAKGFNYLSDEVIFFSSNQQRLGGFPRSLVLKAGSAFIWQRCLGESPQGGFLRFSDGSAWVPPTLWGVDVTPSVEPHLLLFPRYSPGAGFRFEALTQAGALFRVLENLVNARNLPAFGMQEARHLAETTRAFHLEYSDLQHVTAWLEDAL